MVVVVVVVAAAVYDDDGNTNTTTTNNNNETIMFTDSSNKRVCVGLHIRVTRKLIKLNRMTLSLPVPFHITKVYRGNRGMASFIPNLGTR